MDWRKKVVVSFLAGTVSCGPAVMRGTLISKVHEPEESWVQVLPIVSDKTTTTIPIVHSDDEDWIFVIENRSGGKVRQRKIYVTAEIFARHQEGDWIEIANLESISDKDPTRKQSPAGPSENN
jgi:hypothetical protein